MSSLVYIIFLSTLIFISYLGMEFYRQKNWLDKLYQYSNNIVFINPPKGSTHAAQIITDVLQRQQEKYKQQIDKLDEEKKEWMEYMTSWFHEIKTPIAVSKMIYESEENLDSLAEEMDRIEYFVEQALYVSRLNEFHKDYLLQEISLDQLIKDAVKMNMKSFLSKKIQLHLELESVEVITDKKALLYIVNQLLGNALKYTNQSGSITISVKEEKLTIRDTGIGISPEDLPRVFEKGFTGKNGREHYASTGMGLYLARNMAEKLGHSLLIESQINEFTEFTMLFRNGNSLYDFNY
ncbi:sensor histidine kinase [Heyndrickxia sp. NPDC080065]|uniref:sensor histidine kinase n=1 Tax=Heyndrickxia sp. NPDC080065 TaxID=3390568 RepID=UPI003D08CF27